MERFNIHDDESLNAWNRMAMEIKGSIFSLFALFELVSLTSYVRIDTFNIYHGNLENVHNLGGIVGALMSEWVLGSVGVMGYSLILVTAYLAIASFRGVRFLDLFATFLGSCVSSILGAITCYLCFHALFPATSLWQGGLIGISAGAFLNHYLNQTGGLILMGAGFVITLILTTNMSLGEMWEYLFYDEDEDAEDDEGEDEEEPRARKVIPLRNNAKPEKTKKRKRRRSAKKKDGQEPTALEDEAAQSADPNVQESEGETAEGPVDISELQLIPYTGPYSLPSPRLIRSSGMKGSKVSKRQLNANAKKLCSHLLSFQVTGEVTSFAEGPVLTTYEYKPSAGVKLTKIAGLQDDLGVVLGTRELRIVAPIPGKTVVGIEIPRKKPEVTSLKDLISNNKLYSKKSRIPFPIGRATDGTPVFGDLAALPHLLVAGSTGSGKSVFVNCLITSLIYRMTPQQLRMILIDPKMLELNVFEGLPHLLTNVITENQKAFRALNWAVKEMDDRYQLMAKRGCKNIESYNSKIRNGKLPYIVIIVDELADLMMSGGEEVEVAITRLAQKARAAGIHLVIATQRPSTDVITGLIKANIPSRISFKVPSGIDSRTVLDAGGAQELIGKGDMLMVQPATPLRRLHGAFISEADLKAVTKKVRANRDYSKYYLKF